METAAKGTVTLRAAASLISTQGVGSKLFMGDACLQGDSYG